jgi:glycerol-3-phosphate acyltransferase PlsY
MLYYWIFLMGYVIGSIPFAVLVAKTQGVDILQKGSKSSGATNVKRVLGKKYGNLVFFLDFMKGFLPVFITKTHFQSHPNRANTLCAVLLIALALGHSFSIFLKFRGGKGVATTIGGLAVLMPSALLLGLIFWYSVFITTRFVSLASLCLALSLPLNAHLFAYQKEIVWLAFCLMVIIFFRHITNIRRLWQGVENRFNGEQ